MLFFQARQRRSRRSQNADFLAVMRRKILGKLARPEDGFFEAGVAHNHVGERSERRIGQHAAKMEFALEEGRVVLLDGVLDGVVGGIKSLDVDAAREFTAAGAAGNLGEQLKGPYGGAKVRQAERRIGTDDAN